MSGSGTGIVTPYTTHRGMDFDGAADSYLRAANLTGVADGALGIASVWFRVDVDVGAAVMFWADNLFRIFLGLDGAGRLAFRGQTALAATVMSITTSDTYLAGSGWHHVAIAWDQTIPRWRIYADGAVPGIAASSNNVGVIDYNHAAASWSVGGDPAGAQLFNGALSEVYVNLAEYLDIAVAANLEMVRHPNGQPPNIGATGQLVTATAPLIYMAEEAGVMVNLGTGGDIGVVGAPAVSADSPKDRWNASLRYRRRQRRRHAA